MTQPLAGQSQRSRAAFAAVAIAAALISLTSSVLLDLARLDDGRLVGDAADIVRLGSDHAGIFRWCGLLDMLGSYLLFLPLAVCLRNRFHDAHPTTVDIGTVGAVVYGAVGAAAAAAWAGAAPLISAYAIASPSGRPLLATSFAAVIHVVTALWHYVGGPAAATWFVCVAISTRDTWRGFAIYSALLGAATGLASIGTALFPNATSSGPGSLAFLPFAVWPAWLAVRIWRDRTSPRGTSTTA
jgi:hypothetical protein